MTGVGNLHFLRPHAPQSEEGKRKDGETTKGEKTAKATSEEGARLRRQVGSETEVGPSACIGVDLQSLYRSMPILHMRQER